MAEVSLYFDGPDREPGTLRKARLEDGGPDSIPSPSRLRYDADTAHWSFPAAATGTDSSPNTGTVTVPRESVYRVVSLTKTSAVPAEDVVDGPVEISFESLPDEYVTLRSDTQDFLRAPAFDAETGHWEFVSSDPREHEDGMRTVVEQRVPRERVVRVLDDT